MDKPLKYILKNAQQCAGWLTESLNEGGLGIWVWDLETGLVELDETEKEFFGLGHLESPFNAQAIVDQIHPDDVDAVNKALEYAIENESPFTADFRYARPGGDQIWIRGRGSIIDPEGNGHKYLAGVNFDVTQEKEQANQERFLAEEMAHRTKNIIALISGVSRMTARSVDNVADYQAALESRLHAIDAANNFVLTGNGPQSVPIQRLISRTLKMYHDRSRLKVSAENFFLNPRAAQTVSLVLNELATNAIKHGALREEGGNVELKILTQNDRFKLTWIETNPKPIGPKPSHKGFGSKVTLGITKSTFSGEPVFEWRNDGIYYACTWPAEAMGMQAHE